MQNRDTREPAIGRRIKLSPDDVTLQLLAHLAGRSTWCSASASGPRASARCSPWRIPFPPPPPRTSELRRDVAGSLVLWDRATSRQRACRTFGSWPSPTDPSHPQRRAPTGSPGSRAKSFHAYDAGSSPPQDSNTTCAYRHIGCSLPPRFTASESPIALILELNGWSACIPVNASPISLPRPTHDGGRWGGR